MVLNDIISFAIVLKEDMYTYIDKLYVNRMEDTIDTILLHKKTDLEIVANISHCLQIFSITADIPYHSN